MDKSFVPFTRYNVTQLNEASQYKKVRFISVYEKDNQLIGMHPPALCRDYLGDVLYCTKMKKSNAIVYGLDYEPEKDGYLQLDRTKLVLQFNKSGTGTKDKSNLFKNINILWEIEKKCKLKTTELTELDENHLFVRGSKRWLDNNLIYSFYTFILRALCYSEIKNQESWYTDIHSVLEKGTDASYNATEAQYINQISIPKFKVFLVNLKKFFIPMENPTGFSQDLYMSTVHSSSGFVSIINGARYPNKQNPLSVLANTLIHNGETLKDDWIEPEEDDDEI